MKKLIILLVLMCGCGRAYPDLDPIRCSNAFAMYKGLISGNLMIGEGTDVIMVSTLGVPTTARDSMDGTVWYTYLVAEDGTLDQQTPYCGNVALQFVNGRFAQVEYEEAFQ